MQGMDVAPPLICILHSPKDEAPLQGLLRHFLLSERQGMVRLWTRNSIPLGTNLQTETQNALHAADVVLLLVSADLLFEDPLIDLALESAQQRQARVIPVLLRPAPLREDLAQLLPLPRNGKTLSSFKNQDEAFVTVVQEVLAVLPHLASQQAAQKTATEPSGPHATSRRIDDIFRTDGVPSDTLIEPEQLGRIQSELGAPGRGLVVEGPSKVGKSTAVLVALERLGFPAGDPRTRVLKGTSLDTAALLQALAETKRHKRHLIIDDFHRIKDQAQRQLIANAMKEMADQRGPGKLTVIGINPVAGTLVDLLPDLDGRFWVVRMDRQPDTKIAALITAGERAGNLRFRPADELITAADGGVYIAQLLCREAALQRGIDRVPDQIASIDVDLPGILKLLHDNQLRPTFYDRVRNFASFEEGHRGGTLALLWLLSRGGDGHVQIDEAMQRYSIIAPSLSWLRDHLSQCFSRYPKLADLLHYSDGTLSMEDPRLRFYLRRLDWDDLAQASGNGGVRFHPLDGPIFPAPSGERAPRVQREKVGPHERFLLHLSDLHFRRGEDDAAMRAYVPLAQDLRGQGCGHLDAVLLSGDLTTTSHADEYDMARQFLEQLMGGFSVPRERVLIVPGNHDVNWELSEQSYQLVRRTHYTRPLSPGRFVERDGGIIEVRDDLLYGQRFSPFARFYNEVKGEAYPLDYKHQVTAVELDDLLICGLNSAWEIDHLFTDRASIHEGALVRAVERLAKSPSKARMAVWHHPLHSEEPSRIQDSGFLQQLAGAGLRVALHGHIHQANSDTYRYLCGPQLRLCAAGTFGAPVQEWRPGYPLQYNLLRRVAGGLWFETRCRESPTGAWRPDARWAQEGGPDPLPRYFVPL